MSEEENPLPGCTFLVTLKQFEEADINSSLASLNSIDCHDLRQKFVKLSEERPEHEAVFRLLQSLTNYHTDPDSAGEPFKPMMVMEDKRSLVPADLLSDQIEVLADLAPTIENVGLRARLADVSWTIQRKRQDSENGGAILGHGSGVVVVSRAA